MNTPNPYAALLSPLQKENLELQSSGWPSPKQEFLNGPLASVWRLWIFGIVSVIPCLRHCTFLFIISPFTYYPLYV